MRGSDGLLVALTFLTGIFCGAYVYVTAFAPEYEATGPGSEAGSFYLTGREEGECRTTEAGCGGFAVYADRRYRYSESDAATVVEGRLSRGDMDALEAAARASDLDRYDGRSCDGSGWYRYRLVLDDVEYTLASCTAFGASELGTLLVDLPPILSTGASEGGVGQGELRGTLEGIIDGWFTYDER